MHPPDKGVDDKGEGLTTYMVSFPRILQLVRIPVPVFPARAHSTGRLRENFMIWNFQSQIVVVQEGRETLPH